MAFIASTAKELVRNLLTTYVNVGTSALPEWEIIGYKIEDTAIEYNAEIEKVTDILGETHTEVNKTELQLSVEPFRVKPESKLAQKLFDIMKRNALVELSQFEVMNVFGFSGAEGAYDAEVHEGCTLEVLSLGGSNRIEMPFNVHYSNKKTLGTTNTIIQTSATPIVFTELVA